MLKRCNKCDKEKELDQFRNNRNNKGGKEHECKICSSKRIKSWQKKNKEKISKQKKIYHADPKVKERQWKTYVKRKYGISYKRYDELLKSQNHCCDICRRHKDEFSRRLHIDHNHQTGEVRGLLCSNCNSAVGFVKENLSILRSVAEYIKKHE